MSKKKIIIEKGGLKTSQRSTKKIDDRYYLRDGVKTLRPTHFTHLGDGVWAHVPMVAEYPDGDYKNVL